MEALQKELERTQEGDDDTETQSAPKEETKDEPNEFKKVMIFAVPAKTKNASTVEVIIKELALHVDRNLKFKVEHIHTDLGSELQT